MSRFRTPMLRLRSKFLASALALCASMALGATPAPDLSGQRETALEAQVQREQYGGLVVDQTVSVAGQDFYRHFTAAWREDAISERFTLSVHEQASARWGSRIRIEYARRVIYQAALPIARPAIPGLSRQAADIVRQRIAEAETERLLFRDADLAADEI